MPVAPLKDLRVLQLTGGIEVGYCTKILVDAGADLTVVEPPEGHELRRRTVSQQELNGATAPIFDYLHAGATSVVVNDPRNVDELAQLLERADVIVGDALPLPWAELHARYPHLSAVAVTPFGLEGPMVGTPMTDLTFQAGTGGMAPRGAVEGQPLMVGGDPSYWFAASIAAVSFLGVLGRVEASGAGELIDVSIYESTSMEHSMHPVTFNSVAGKPFHNGRGVPVPGIEPTADGFVGFFVITGQQWLDFCSLIGKPEWQEDESLFLAMERRLRADELQGPIREWTKGQTTAEIVEIASLMRIPVSPIGTGETLLSIDHFVSEDWFAENEAGFTQPRRPYRFEGDDPVDPGSPAEQGAGDLGKLWASPRRFAEPAADVPGSAPLEGLRVADFTGFWAGPLASGILAGLGADVIHVEGPTRPDGIRMNTVKSMKEDGWWEWSPLYIGANSNKRGLVLDLTQPDGHEAAMRLIKSADVMVDNFSPRVVDQLGINPEAVHAVNPELVVVRMPAFGVSGPWRERVGFAQTIEQAAGIAFLTGYKGEAPTIPNGMCDAIAGVHGAIAMLLAIAEKQQTGSGQVVESPMIGGAINTTAEQVAEFSAFGEVVRSLGNGSPFMSQDVYRAAGNDQWVAVSLQDDRAARAVEEVVGSIEGDAIAAWCAARSKEEAVDQLRPLGVAVAPVRWAQEMIDDPQLQARKFYEQIDHPIVGKQPCTGWPARFSAGPEIWNRSAAPTMGQHNAEVLAELGYSAEEIEKFAESGIISEGVVTRQKSW